MSFEVFCFSTFLLINLDILQSLNIYIHSFYDPSISLLQPSFIAWENRSMLGLFKRVFLGRVASV